MFSIYLLLKKTVIYLGNSVTYYLGLLLRACEHQELLSYCCGVSLLGDAQKQSGCGTGQQSSGVGPNDLQSSLPTKTNLRSWPSFKSSSIFLPVDLK